MRRPAAGRQCLSRACRPARRRTQDAGSAATSAASRSPRTVDAVVIGARNSFRHSPCAASNAFTGPGLGSSNRATVNGLSCRQRCASRRQVAARERLVESDEEVGAHVRARGDRAGGAQAARREPLVVVAAQHLQAAVDDQRLRLLDAAAAVLQRGDARMRGQRQQRGELDAHAGAGRDVVDDQRRGRTVQGKRGGWSAIAVKNCLQRALRRGAGRPAASR